MLMMLDEEGLGDHGSGATGPDQPGDGGQQMDEEDGQVAHGLGIVPTISPLARLGISGDLWHKLRIGHTHGRRRCPRKESPPRIGTSSRR